MTIRELLEAKNIDTKKIDKEINTGKFFDAVQSGDCDKIRYFIHSGVDINTKYKYGCTALINASDSNKKKVVRLLIELGADINIRDDEGQTALMKAAFVNADEVVAILIRSGADINVKDNQGQTPFMMAALSDSKTVAETLAEFGADVDAVDNQGKKALDIAGLSFARFIRDGESREKINFKRIRHVLDAYPNFKNYGIIRGFKDAYKKKYGHDLCTPYLDSYLKDFNSEKNDKILMVIGEDEIQVMPSKVAIQDFLNLEFASKNYGYKSDVRTKFLEKYKYELEDRILNGFIKNFADKHADKILKELDDGRIQVMPSKVTIQQFLNSEFANKDFGYKSDIRTKFLERYKYELEDDILRNFIRGFTDKNTDRILNELDDGTIQLASIKEMVQQFLDYEFANKDYGYKSEVRVKFLEKYHCELADDVMSGSLITFNEKYTDKVLNKLDDGRIQVAPSNEIVHQFLSSEFANKDYGYKSDVRAKFLEKYHCELADDVISDFRINFNDKYTDKILGELGDGRILVAPSELVVQHFLRFEFCDKDYGYKSDVRVNFFKKYRCKLPDGSLSDFIIKFAEKDTNKILNELNDGTIQITPSEFLIHQFLNSEFYDKGYGYKTNAQAKFLEKYHCELTERALSDFAGKDTNKILTKLCDGTVQVAPSESAIQEFLTSEFANKDYGYKSDVQAKFLEKYHCELTERALSDFIEKFNKKNTNKHIRKSDGENVLVEPCYNEIQKFLLNEFEKGSGVQISKNEIRRKFKTKYKCELGNYDLEMHVYNFNSSIADRMIVSKDNCYQIVTKIYSGDKELSSLSRKIQSFFLTSFVGYSCSINSMKKGIGCECVSDEEMILAMQIANSNLKDIKIVFKDDGKIKSSFKCTGTDMDNYDMGVCPVCGENFSKCNNINIKCHILGHYSSGAKNCAILNKTGETREGILKYFCSHCNKEYAFDDNISIIYRHLLGACSYYQRSVYKPIGGGNMHNTIWKGAAYANGDAFLGNSGQLLREDNGRFGSYPLEDNYGDGD